MPGGDVLGDTFCLIGFDADGQRGVQVPDEPGKIGGHLSELASPPLGVNPEHLLASHGHGQHEPFRVLVLDRVQRVSHRLGGGVGVPVGRCRYRQPHQVAWGDLQGIGQRHDVGQLVQSDFSALDPVQFRFAHSGQTGDHHQRLAPGIT